VNMGLLNVTPAAESKKMVFSIIHCHMDVPVDTKYLGEIQFVVI
jgi:hypothetical protein